MKLSLRTKIKLPWGERSFVTGPDPFEKTNPELQALVDEDTPADEWVAIDLDRVPVLVAHIAEIGKLIGVEISIEHDEPTREEVQMMDPELSSNLDDDSLAAAGDAYRDEQETNP